MRTSNASTKSKCEISISDLARSMLGVKGYTPQSLADALGISTNAASHVLRSNGDLRANRFYDLCVITGISPSTYEFHLNLIHKAEMTSSDNDNEGLSKTGMIENLADIFDSLTPEARSFFLAYLRCLHKSNFRAKAKRVQT